MHQSATARDPVHETGDHNGPLPSRSQPAERCVLPSGHRVQFAPEVGFDGRRARAVVLIGKGIPETGCLFHFVALCCSCEAGACMEHPNRFAKLFWIGTVVAAVVAYWWNGEVVGRLGARAGGGSFHCLLNFGTGDCSSLWFVGLHSTNQFASLLFWGSAGTAIWALARSKGLKDKGK